MRSRLEATKDLTVRRIAEGIPPQRTLKQIPERIKFAKQSMFYAPCSMLPILMSFISGQSDRAPLLSPMLR